MTLLIDGKSCPAGEITKIPIDFSIRNLTNPQSACKGSTMELVIPSTAQSNAIFGTARDIYAAERFNDNHHTASLICDGVVMFEGTIYLLQASMNDRFGGHYKVRIVAGAKEWAKSASRRELRSSGLRFNMTLTPENICATWSGTQPVRMLPVARNRYSALYSSSSLAPLEQILTTDDYHPFFSVPALFEKIFSGYSVGGRFWRSSEFRQLMFSGQYASPDTSKQKMLLDFRARLSTPKTATADSYGKVYATASFDGSSSLGNIVDTANPMAVDSNGNSMQDTFTTANVFGIDDQGYCRFESSIAASVGFLLHLEYQTDYRIESRTSLKGFNRITAEPDVEAIFNLTNGFQDQRNNPTAGINYNLCIFDLSEGELYKFKVTDANTSAALLSKTIESRFTSITIPEGCTPICTLESMSGERLPDNTDWALYFGHVGEYGTTDVAVDIRIPPQEFTAGEKMRFNSIRISGAEPEMKITLSTACSLQPYFSNVPGFGSVITLADIAHQKIWLIELVEAICQMYNLIIFTDERTKQVFIEPMEDFYSNKVWSWSDKIDHNKPIIISDIGIGEPYTVERRYKGGDFASEQFNDDHGTDIGCWRVTNQIYGAADTTDIIENPLFTTGISRNGIYAFAPSASILQVGDSAAEGSMEQPFTPHIVRYAGLKPLPEGEIWGPTGGNEYPLAAFFFSGNEQADGFSLCFENRDGITGLHRYFDAQAERTTTRQRLSLTLHLTPAEVEQLLSADSNGPTIRDNFRLKTFNESSLYRLESLKNYDPSTRSAECTFIRLTKD